MITYLIFGFFGLLVLAIPVGHVLVISSGAAILATQEFPVMLVAQQMVNQTLSFPMLALPFYALASGSLLTAIGALSISIRVFLLGADARPQGSAEESVV